MTGDGQSLADQADRLEALLSSVHEIHSRKDAARAKALVALRRELSAQVATLALVVRPILERTYNPATQAEFRRLHSALLASLALHQANWPAVLLLQAFNDAEYAQSASGVDTAGRALIAWLRMHR